MRFLRPALLALPLLALAGGCGRAELLPFLGKWAGALEVERVDPPGQFASERHRMDGYVQVYRTQQRYILELRGEQQAVKVTGNWELEAPDKKDRIVLTPKRVTIDDGGGEDKRDPNKVFIPNKDVQAAYSRPMVLILAPDKKSLAGLTVTVGPILGAHRFRKDSF